MPKLICPSVSVHSALGKFPLFSAVNLIALQIMKLIIVNSELNLGVCFQFRASQQSQPF